MAKLPLFQRAMAAWKVLSSAEQAGRAGGHRPTRTVRSVYRGAETSRLFGDFNPRTQPPVEELRGALRTLRARARDLGRNEGLATQFIRLATTNVLGPRGMRLQAQVRDASGNLDERANAVIEAAWNRWRAQRVSIDRRMTFSAFERLSFRTAITDGETFIRPIVGPDEPHGLSLQGLDADVIDDRLSTSFPVEGSEVWLGVEVDGVGRPLAYHVMEGLYSNAFYSRQTVRVPASEVLHAYISERFNQARGISWFAPAIVPGQHLNGFIEAVLVGARAGAGQMAFVEQTDESLAGADESPDGGAEPVETEIEPGTITRLAPGEKLSAFTPSQPSDAFTDFTKDIKRHVAACLGVNYAQLASDYAEANYSSMRAAQLVDRDLWRALQIWWIEAFLQPIFERWLQAAMLAGELPLDGRDWRRYTAHRWIPRGWPWVDPLKDVQASEMELDLGLTSVTRILAERGEDIEDILEERRDEQLLAKRYGQDLQRVAKAPKPAPPDEEQDDDEGQDEEAGDEAGTRRAGPRESLPAAVAARVNGHAGAAPARNGKSH